MRRTLGVLIASLCVSAACDYRGPLSPFTAPPTPLTITSLTLSANRTHVPWPTGAVVVSAAVVAATGIPQGVPVELTMKQDGLPDTLTRIVLDANGTGSTVLTFAKPGAVVARLDSFSQEIRITQDAAPAPVEFPPSQPPSPNPPQPQTPTITASATPETYAPSAGSAFTVTARASLSNGSTPSDFLYDFDADGDGVYEFRSDQPTGGVYSRRAVWYSSAGTRTMRVRVVRQSGTNGEGSAIVILTVQPPG